MRPLPGNGLLGSAPDTTDGAVMMKDENGVVGVGVPTRAGGGKLMKKVDEKGFVKRTIHADTAVEE